ncbi:EamA family transporter [Nocardioides bruguierae]|uniref:DMT family transporter n=1 Tax=Nocardioides bruguierae TaxID=2945102 RepID=A0A9X2IDY7_9ACTN|nr:EamA family transporter [Nocardioides bruguierae]MCM0618789.1 DMT family transporter [Nocardioides bruguierae]
MAVLLALASAFAYGLSDFIGGRAATRTTPWAVAFVGQLTAAVLIGVLSLVRGGAPDGVDLLWAVVAGTGGGLGAVFLYRGLSTGRMGVVAPVSGVGAAVLPVVVGLSLGERPGVLVGLGIVAALPGIWLVAREPSEGGGGATAGPLRDGLLAGAGFGILFVGLAQVPDEAGLLPVALNHLVAALITVVAAVVVHAHWLPGRRESRGTLAAAAAGVLAAGATTAFLLASQGGYLTVVAVIASLYPAFTVALAALVLRERVHRAQGAGLVLCAVAVGMVAAG